MKICKPNDLITGKEFIRSIMLHNSGNVEVDLFHSSLMWTSIKNKFGPWCKGLKIKKALGNYWEACIIEKDEYFPNVIHLPEDQEKQMKTLWRKKGDKNEV